MHTVELDEAGDRVAEVVEEVRGGESVTDVRDSRPVTQPTAPSQVAGKRRPGSAKGLITIHDNFDDPMPEDFMRYFE